MEVEVVVMRCGDGLELSGVIWSGLEWCGVVWSGLEWSGNVWSGLEGSGVEERGGRANEDENRPTD